MLIKFYNLGSIKETELDLRPLTVIIGPNNSNKTYIAYSVYALWEEMRKTDYSSICENIKKHIVEEDENKWSLIIKGEFIELLQTTYMKQGFKLNMGNFFQDSTGKLFQNTKFDFNPSLQGIKESLDKIVDTRVSFKNGELNFSITGDVLSIQLNQFQPLSQFNIIDWLSFIIPRIIFPPPLPLPAERNAFILTYKLLSNRRYKLLKDGQRQPIGNQIEILKEQGDTGYPKPIEDFLDFLVDVEIAKDQSTEIPFQQLADDIEDHIQNKNKTYFETMKLGRDLKVKVKRGLDIDLHNASSSIKQLAPLLLYLRYRAKKNDFLIIDEPELGLHPESQAKLLETLAIMVNLGIRILITTHSPYFMSHLNNIVSGDVDNPELLKQQASSLYMNDSRAFLSMEQVSAYEMKRNKLRSLKDKDFGIRWDTLSDVSADIQQKYFEIHEKKEMFSNGKK